MLGCVYAELPADGVRAAKQRMLAAEEYCTVLMLMPFCEEASPLLIWCGTTE